MFIHRFFLNDVFLTLVFLPAIILSSGLQFETLLDNRTTAHPGLTYWILTQAEAVIVILRYHQEQTEDNKQFALLEH